MNIKNEENSPPSSDEVIPISPLLILVYVLLGGLIGVLLIFLFKNLFIENIKNIKNIKNYKI